MSEERIDNYAEFWDFYVLEHSKPMTRYFHFVGTSLGMVIVAWFVKGGDYIYIPLGFVVAYAFAWFSHFFIEKNKPATFKYRLQDGVVHADGKDERGIGEDNDCQVSCEL
jgi:hypothetical protein